ncbi:AraC family transcriptional regulator [Moheibacter sediminis]|uniref:Transcriptional regulator, AraC family n=1 Tax=Moheibacter sediminis TaxID=1434700 RepID=A0A1W2AWW4_9FLAO|nr:AraC family transcriptional regulator [Moheibacter sediminis]SMC65205.1 transcriptional regulator, AraC family [Moheibacter sediminis]
MIKLQIKNMVCPRCIMAVENVLNEMKVSAIEIRLGEVLLNQELKTDELSTFKSKIEKLGFELLDDKNSALINKIKSIIIGQIHEKNENFVLSELISFKLNKEYSQLSKLFSATVGMTIEHFAILQKIEKVKELLVYDELSLKEIAFQLDYSSSAHLSAQFKKVTGFTPSEFKSLGNSERKGIDGI